MGLVDDPCARPDEGRAVPLAAVAYRDGSAAHRNDEVAIAGEPGVHRYRVLGVCPERGYALIAGELGCRYRVPVQALLPLRRGAEGGAL